MRNQKTCEELLMKVEMRVKVKARGTNTGKGKRRKILEPQRKIKGL